MKSISSAFLAILTICLVHQASAVDVTFSSSYVGHAAIGTWDGDFLNASMNARPDILPFVSSATNAPRYTGNHPLNLLGGGNILAGIYTRLDGVGTSGVTALGTSTSVFGRSSPNSSIQTFSTGSRLPLAGASGTLNSTLNLPNGLSLATGTLVYADFYSYVLDYGKPANYWYDSATKLQHQGYEGGTMDFYYKDGANQYQLFARYQNSVIRATVDYVNNSDSWTWSGSSTGVNNVLLPASITYTNNPALNESGVIPSELLGAEPYVGFFDLRTRSFTVNFDTSNASLVQQPLTALESWRQLHFGTTSNTGTAANGSDFDKDGLVNLLEFAFGLNPILSDAQLMPQPQRVGNELVISFTPPSGVSGITYGAESSTTLVPGSWLALPDTGIAPVREFRVTLGSKPKDFLRWVITAPTESP